MSALLQFVAQFGLPTVLVLIIILRIEPAMRDLRDDLTKVIDGNTRATTDMAKAITELSTLIKMLRSVNGGQG